MRSPENRARNLWFTRPACLKLLNFRIPKTRKAISTAQKNYSIHNISGVLVTRMCASHQNIDVLKNLFPTENVLQNYNSLPPIMDIYGLFFNA